MLAKSYMSLFAVLLLFFAPFSFAADNIYGYQKHINRLEGYLERKGALDKDTLAKYKAGGCDSEPRSCSASIRSPIDKQTFDTLIGLRKQQAKSQRLNENPLREGTNISGTVPVTTALPPVQQPEDSSIERSPSMNEGFSNDNGAAGSVSTPPRQIRPPKNSQGGGSGGEINQPTAAK
jgi:hypothetical protein